MPLKKKTSSTEIQIHKITQGKMDLCIVGNTPLICNRISEKVKRELLLPKGRKTAADKASTLKHDPMAEYQASPYTDLDNKGDTYLQVLASMFKGAMVTAAGDATDAAKTQIKRLLWCEPDRISVYGVPQMLMSVTRCKDIGRTPDVRTRAILPEWACRVSITYVTPLLKEQSVANLIASAGITVGIGDWRAEKGAGCYGSYELVGKSDSRYKRIVKGGGRAAQKKAMEKPEFYDQETEELFAWYETEVRRRGMKVVK